MNHDSKDLHELKHEPRPGFGWIFAVAFIVMAAYLAFILYTSPGTVAHP